MNINIPNSVTSIGNNAFCECDNLGAEVKSKIESINPGAFCEVVK